MNSGKVHSVKNIQEKIEEILTKQKDKLFSFFILAHTYT
jgi:hypothetical protein